MSRFTLVEKWRAQCDWRAPNLQMMQKLEDEQITRNSVTRLQGIWIIFRFGASRWQMQLIVRMIKQKG